MPLASLTRCPTPILPLALSMTRNYMLHSTASAMCFASISSAFFFATAAALVFSAREAYRWGRAKARVRVRVRAKARQIGVVDETEYIQNS